MKEDDPEWKKFRDEIANAYESKIEEVTFNLDHKFDFIFESKEWFKNILKSLDIKGTVRFIRNEHGQNLIKIYFD
jgi:hypothetical protein